MSDSARIVTAEDLEQLPRDDRRYELVEGRLRRMGPVGFRHGCIVTRVLYLLGRHLEGRNLGAAVTEVGFKLASSPDTVRAPDIAFIRRDRIPSPETKGFLDGPPDLAIEVISPDDRPSAIRDKVEEYLTRGVTLVLVIDPDERAVVMYRPLTAPVTASASEVIDLGDVVPGFRCTVREIFDRA